MVLGQELVVKPLPFQTFGRVFRIASESEDLGWPNAIILTYGLFNVNAVQLTCGLFSVNAMLLTYVLFSVNAML